MEHWYLPTNVFHFEPHIDHRKRSVSGQSTHRACPTHSALVQANRITDLPKRKKGPLKCWLDSILHILGKGGLIRSLRDGSEFPKWTTPAIQGIAFLRYNPYLPISSHLYSLGVWNSSISLLRTYSHCHAGENASSEFVYTYVSYSNQLVFDCCSLSILEGEAF